ncbi:hypothetical protein CTI12_AA588790 [Artemisia annua]|uniref:Uncharacterized protein n=1 Tax=Artemisia annua TaxID=35608 RepID=A0A2U1KLQ8_ARTAN|nr:hypothetical protein CTI12_AA588790 [Artemisia annua]
MAATGSFLFSRELGISRSSVYISQAKLESFRKTLMMSLQDEDGSSNKSRGVYFEL